MNSQVLDTVKATALANRRAASAKALADMAEVRASFRAGRTGACQVERIAAAHANPRVQALVVANDKALAAQAEAVGHQLFQLMVTNWVNQLDQDGPRDRNQRSHESRDFKLHRDFDATWVFTGGCASLQGTEMADIFDHFYEAETMADWADARARIGQVRRAIVGADSVVTDLGRLQRLFSGSPALAVRLSCTECCWPGCHVPVSNCQIDHLDPWTDRGGGGGGCTNPGNGGPLCGRHNRLKEHAYTVWRDPTGKWHVYRPDGTEIL